MGEKRKVNFQFNINNTIFLDEEKDSVEEAKRLREEIKNRLFDWPGNFSIDSSILIEEKNNSMSQIIGVKSEEIAMSKKPKFRLENYQGHYVMHCNTEEKAKIFCDFLHDAGKTWRDNTSYSEATYWEIYESDTVYYFNTGLFGTTQYVIGDFIILEFDDFNWE